MTNSDEISKNFKLLNEGPLDSFWGPYATTVLACAAVPSAVRPGKTVGIGTTTITEYTWHPGDLTDNGLVRKISKGRFGIEDSTTDQSRTMVLGDNTLGITAENAAGSTSEIFIGAVESHVTVFAPDGSYGTLDANSGQAKLEVSDSSGVKTKLFVRPGRAMVEKAGVGKDLATSFNGVAADVNGNIVALQNVDNTSDAAKNSAAVTLTNKTIIAPLGIVKADVGLSNVDNTSDLAKPISTAAQTSLNLKADLNQLTNNQAQGAWNASTNTPTLSATPLTVGKYYEVSVAGTSSVPTGGSIAYSVGDKLISNGTVWQYIPFVGTKIATWSAIAFPLNAQVNYLGKFWKSSGATLATDVPGTSALWVEMLSGYLDKSTVNTTIGKNLFNKDSFVIDKFIQSNTGAIVVLTNGKISEQIPVTASTQYTLSGHAIPAPSVNLGLRYEDANHNILSFLTISSNASVTFTTPASCVFIVMGLYRPDYPQSFASVQIELGAVATTFESYRKYTDKANSQKIAAEYVNTDLGIKTLPEYVVAKAYAAATSQTVNSKNIFNKDSTVIDTYINASDGNNLTLAGAKISAKIAVLPSATYTVSGVKKPAVGSLVIRYETSAFVKISYIQLTSNVNVTFTTPSNCAYIVMSLYRADYPTDFSLTQIEAGSTATAFTAYTAPESMVNLLDGKKVIAEKLNTDLGYRTIQEYLSDKGVAFNTPSTAKVVAFGDSITARTDNWTTTFNQLIAPLTLTNMGISGARIAWASDTVETATPIADTPPNNVLWNQIKKWEATTPAVPTAFIIAIGTNDISQGSTIGTMTDAFAQSEALTSQLTTANAFRKAIQYLMNAYPNTQIFYCTPIQSKTGGRSWTSLSGVSLVLTDVAKHLNVKVIDCFNQSGIIDEYEGVGVAGRYLIDGVHPSAAGAAKHGKYIAKEFGNKYII